MKVPGIMSRFPYRRRASGFTLIEVGIVLLTVGVLSSVGIIAYAGLDETRDAAMVQSVQTQLQTTVSQAVVRLDVTPDSLSKSDLVSVLKTNLTDQAVLDNTLKLSLSKGKRSAAFAIAANGDVGISSISGFSRYQISNNNTLENK
jgi:type II secretory pathway pseudopilin PulG